MNKKFVNQMNSLAMKHRNETRSKLAEDMTPPFYAAMCLALFRLYDFSEDDLIEVIEETMKIWNSGTADEIIKMCAVVTGLKIERKK